MEEKKHLYLHVPHLHQPKAITLEDAREAHKARGGINASIAVFITKYFGSMPSFYILIFWMLGWILLATLDVGPFGRDSYPFQFLLFLSNLVQLWALPAIMVGQNVQGQHTELLSEETAKTTQKNYQNSEQMMEHLSEQDKELLRQTSELLKQTPMLVEILTLLKAQQEPARKR